MSTTRAMSQYISIYTLVISLMLKPCSVWDSNSKESTAEDSNTRTPKPKSGEWVNGKTVQSFKPILIYSRRVRSFFSQGTSIRVFLTLNCHTKMFKNNTPVKK